MNNLIMMNIMSYARRINRGLTKSIAIGKEEGSRRTSQVLLYSMDLFDAGIQRSD